MDFLEYDSNGRLTTDVVVRQSGKTYMIPSGSYKLLQAEHYTQSHQPRSNTGSLTVTSISAYDHFEVRTPTYTSSFIATPIPANYVTSSTISPDGETIPNNIANLASGTYLSEHPKNMRGQHKYFFITGSTLALSIKNLGEAIINSRVPITCTTSSTAIFFSSSLANGTTASLGTTSFVSGSTVLDLSGEKPVSESIQYRVLGNNDGEVTPLESASVVFQHDETDVYGKNSFMITGSGLSKVYFSSSGKFGIGTTDPTDEVDIKADSFKVRSADGLREIEFDNSGYLKTKAYGKEAAKSGSELVMVYTSGSFEDEILPPVGSRLGQIRWTVESGSLAGRELEDLEVQEKLNKEQRGGTAAKIFSDITAAETEGVVGNIVFAIPAEASLPPTEIMKLQDSHVTVTGSLSVDGVFAAGRVLLDGNGYLDSDPLNSSGLYLSAAAKVNGHITASGNISASGTIYGSSLDIAKDTDASAEIGRAHVGNMGHSDYGGISHVDQNGTTTYALLQSSGGSTFLNSKSGTPIYLRVNNTTVGQIESTGLEITGEITASGNISASGEIQASSFVGTPIILEQLSIYATSVDGSVPQYRAGSTAGVEAGNWQSNISSRTNPTANEALYGMLLPFKMKNVSLKATARSQGGGAPALWMYTGSRVDGTSTYDLGFAASASCGVVGASNGAYNIDITGSAAFDTRTEDDTLFLYLGNDTAATDTMRVTVIIYGEKAE
jgi:hypothetical protein